MTSFMYAKRNEKHPNNPMTTTNNATERRYTDLTLQCDLDAVAYSGYSSRPASHDMPWPNDVHWANVQWLAVSPGAII